MSLSFSCLILSDLHFTENPQDNTYTSVRRAFLNDLKRIINNGIKELPDLILVIGDIVFSGKQNEYEKFTAFYEEIISILTPKIPIILTIPGNHDLLRPEKGSDDEKYFLKFKKYASLTENNPWKKNINDQFFQQREYKKVSDLFKFFNNLQQKLHPIEGNTFGDNIIEKMLYSGFPGDFYCRINISGKRKIGIVGLNSSWLHCNRGNHTNKICIPLDQFRLLFPEDERSELNKNSFNIIFFHHPPSEFEVSYREEFYREILPLFNVCIYGHEHISASEFKIIYGEKKYIEIQADSLFGTRKKKGRKIEKSFGFSIFQVNEFNSVRIWPYRYISNGANSNFLWNQMYGDLKKDGILLNTDTTTCDGKVDNIKDINRLFDDNSTSKSVTLIGVDSILSGNELNNIIKNFPKHFDALKVIFPKRENIKKYYELIFHNNKKLKEAEFQWDNNYKILKKLFYNNINYDCLVHEGMIPFEAIIFDNNKIYFKFLQKDYRKFPYIKFISNYSCYNHIKKQIEETEKNSIAICEYNVCGDYNKEDKNFKIAGIIPEKLWQNYRRNENIKETFLATICLIFINYEVGRDIRLLLHKRDKIYCNGDLGRLSLFSTKIINRDFDKFENEYQYEKGNYTGDDFEQDSITFCKKIFEGTNKGANNRLLPENKLKAASLKAAVRMFSIEFGIDVDENNIELMDNYKKYIEKEEFNLYVMLCKFSISASDYNLLRKKKINWELKEMTLNEFEDNKKNFNDFINNNFDKISNIFKHEKKIYQDREMND